MADYIRSGDELKTTCTFCHTENKLYLNFHKQLYYCFKCHKKGRIGKDLINKVKNLPPPKPKDPEPLPLAVIPLKDSPPAMAYLSTRQVVMRDDWLFCYEGEYANRIVFPVYCHGRYYGFQARTILPPSMEPIRYRSSRNLPLSKILYNYDKTPRGVEIVIAEGILASTRFTHGVSVFTKRISFEQASLLSVKASRIVIAFDKDALQEAVLGGYVLNRCGIHPYIMLMKHKGPDDHTVEELEHLEVRSLFDFNTETLHEYQRVYSGKS